MFGLKLISKANYQDLEEQVSLYQREATDKAVEVSNLQGEVKFLNSRIAELEAQLAELQANKKPVKEAVLLTDVSESALVEEKPVKKTRKGVKTAETAKPRKKVVHKSNE